MKNLHCVLVGTALLTFPSLTSAGVGDPQIRTDHPWYPGELACSTFERLFATQAEVYERVVGVKPVTDEQKALAAWLWRNTHFWHGEEGAEDLWGQGFTKGGDVRSREYWTGMFAHGFGLCGTSHSQWVAEMEALLGHGRGRGVGVEDHVSFEVYLAGGAYRAGKWALLDHDISTVIFDRHGKSLLSLQEVHQDWQQLASRSFMPARQPWLVCGLAAADGSSYRRYDVAEYLSGYAGAPPSVHLRRGETLRRYFQPGLENGKTYVFWGRNYGAGGIPGPERSQTWVNQPDKMYQSREGAGFKTGQARFANAVYTYKPNFGNDDYKEGVVEESDDHVVFEFYTPYIIAATPAGNEPWGIYQPGCRNGLILGGAASCTVSLSTDQGATWQECGKLTDGMDLTDIVKGRRQYLLRLGAGAKVLRQAQLIMTTVCQANQSILPRLKDGGSKLTYLAAGRGVVSAGPNLDQAKARLIAGKFGTPEVTLAVASPRKEPVVGLHAAAHIASGNPPRPDVQFQIEVSLDDGKTWQPMVKDWRILRRGHEPADFWSQSFCWGSMKLTGTDASRVQVRFRNTGGKAYLRAEAHLLYAVKEKDGVRVTYSWTDDRGAQRSTHDFVGVNKESNWQIPTGRDVRTHWVEMEPVRID